MSKAIFPVAVAYAHRDILRRGNSVERIYPDARYGPESLGLYTAKQAEAYANARVREALEAAISAVESCRTTGTIRYGTVSDCIEAIRTHQSPGRGKAVRIATKRQHGGNDWEGGNRPIGAAGIKPSPSM